jgi:hypothetical protein
MAPRPVETSKKRIVGHTGLRANDVLLGRGSGPSQYEGNRRFRGVVWNAFQEYLQGEQARHFHRGEKLERSFPTSLSTSTKSRLCSIVREKISLMHGRFLRKVTSASVGATTDFDPSIICVSHNEYSKNKDGKKTFVKTYYKIVDEKQVLNKIKQALRFLLEQKLGRKEHADVAKMAEATTSGDENSGGQSFASAVTPVGILSQGQTGQVRAPAFPNDNLGRLFSACQALPSSPVLAPIAWHDTTSFDVLTSTHLMLLLQQRRQQQNPENERTLGLLQFLRTGENTGSCLHSSNAGNATRQQQALALSMAMSRSGFSGYGVIPSEFPL